jgi:hypothetical protein
MLVLCKKQHKLGFGCCLLDQQTATMGGGVEESSILSTPTMKISKRDYKFIPMTPDVDFSPERNKRVIEGSIRKYEAMRKKKQDQFMEGIGERSEAVASFLHHVKQGRHNNVDEYFGKSTLTKLRGLEIIDDLRSRLNMITPPSPVYIQGGMVKNIRGDIVGSEVANVKKKQKRQKKLD